MAQNTRINKRNKSTLTLWLLVIVVTLLVLFLVRATWKMYKKYHLAGTTRDYREDLLRRSTQNQEQLEKDLAYFETEEGIESIIRDQYRVTKEGEKLIVLTDDETFVLPTKESSRKKGLFSWIGRIFKRN